MDHALAADAALDRQDGVIRMGRQGPQMGPLVGEVFCDDAIGRGMTPGIGDGLQPIVKAGIEFIKVAKTLPEEEILPDIAKRPLDLALCLGAIGLARARC
ncbi:hypothetical protein JZX93_17255, partial [Acidomonas methanolica]|nr:hypothetical protein [Acidomonas methanolica]